MGLDLNFECKADHAQKLDDQLGSGMEPLPNCQLKTKLAIMHSSLLIASGGAADLGEPQSRLKWVTLLSAC